MVKGKEKTYRGEINDVIYNFLWGKPSILLKIFIVRTVAYTSLNRLLRCSVYCSSTNLAWYVY